VLERYQASLLSAVLALALGASCGAPRGATESPAPSAQPPVGAQPQVSTPTQATQSSPVRLGHNRTWSNPALVLGMAQGWFERAGVTVVEEEFTDPIKVLQGMATGELDVGPASGPTLFSAVEQGIKAKGVALLQGQSQPPLAYSVRTDSGINSPRDLRGKKAGINDYGGIFDLYLRYWVERAGLDPQTDLEILIVPVPAVVGALVNRQVDIVPLGAIPFAVAQQQYPNQVKPLFDYDEIMKAGIGNTNQNALVLVFSDAFIQRDRATAVKFLEGYLRSIHAIHADPQKALNDWADFTKIEGLRRVAGPPIIPDDGKIYLDALQFDADLAVRFGYLKQPIDVRNLVDHSLIEQAAAQVK
jgi:ABC-type nitrate/sulfonate/bicarbonate transport system substrate-binding protein